jgi:hypothetical protein
MYSLYKKEYRNFKPVGCLLIKDFKSSRLIDPSCKNIQKTMYICVYVLCAYLCLCSMCPCVYLYLRVCLCVSVSVCVSLYGCISWDIEVYMEGNKY